MSAHFTVKRMSGGERERRRGPVGGGEGREREREREREGGREGLVGEGGRASEGGSEFFELLPHSPDLDFVAGTLSLASPEPEQTVSDSEVRRSLQLDISFGSNKIIATCLQELTRKAAIAKKCLWK